MLSIQPARTQKCTPNLLPARINHNGPINNAQQYWKPETDSKGKQHAFFRGRHLHGTALPLPANYTGAILHVTDKTLPHSQAPGNNDGADGDDVEEADEEESLPVEVKIAEQIGEFDEMVVWGHGGEVDGAQDVFVRGMQEWVGFAESMHGTGDEEDSTDEKKVVNKARR
ncbi:uncharacterized protein K460DRAFT_380933 [Cucurbitaria berberidis CBS 394.84]|uniref:Uncharacterized protein n=1 Tax=Cucurbitaria berberidis CBS 394.84 TaxID=1168544 RepID=A0A9P4G9L7_9PLEO|nr:uncharacterized protein K460DRAFT_380933 [Cucurbitaria berberidis CBS 394.84]KAF1841224.1 hypothetical protein K460DRAFT_380933 [Cucurbitaria berberidis CBS 394.84]